jgi:hypothetical protein
MRWHLNNNSRSWSWLLNVAEREVATILLQVVVLSGLVDTADSEQSSVGGERVAELNLVTSQVSVANEGLARLVDIESLRKLLSSQVDGERVSAVVGEVHASDLNSVISKEVIPDELFILTSSEEPQDFAVEVKELLLRGDSATTELLLEIFKQLRVLLWGNGLERLSEAIFRASLCVSLGSAEINEEFSSVGISVVDSDGTAADTDVETDSEVSWLERHLGSILSEYHLSLKESTLRSAGVDDLRLDDLNRSVLEVVVNHELSDAVVLKARLNNALLEVAIEAEYLLVKLGIGGLVQLVDVGSLVVRVLHLAETLAHVSLLGQELLCDGARKSMKVHNLVLSISNCFKFDVRDLFVVYEGRVVGRHVAWEFWEV